MATAASLIVRLQAETAEFHQQMRSAAQMANDSLNRISSAASVAQNALAGLLGIDVGRGFLSQLVSETERAEQSQIRLEAVIRATGGTVGFTARQLQDLAQSMARNTLFDVPQIQNAEAVLSTFGNVTGDTFTKTIKLASDMATLFDGDLSQATIKLGRALNDPAKGLTALQRVGVQFDPAQRAIIQGFLKTNDLASAQAYILDNLSSRFGGLGGAANQGLAGAVHGARVEYEEFLASLGKTQQAGGALRGIADFFQQFFAKRIFTTDPLEDLRISLDQTQSKIEAAKAAMATEGPDFRIEGMQPADYIRWQEAIAASQERRIKNTENQRKADDAAAAGKKKDVDNAGDVAARTAAIDNEIEALKREAIQLTEGARAALLYRLETEHATDAQVDAALAAFHQVEAAKEHNKAQKEADDNTKSINDQIDALREQAATFGQSDEQIALYELGQKHASQTQLDAVRSLYETIDAHKEYQAELDATEKAQEKLDKREEELQTHMLKNIQDGFAKFLTSFATSTENAGNLFVDFMKRIVEAWLDAEAQLVAAQFFQMLLSLGGSAVGVEPGSPGDPTGPNYDPSWTPNGSMSGLRAVTAGAGGGSGAMHVTQNIHFHVAAMDGPSVAAMLRTQAPTIAGIVADAAHQSNGFRTQLFTR